MLFQGIENMLQAGQAADSDEIGAAWQELVGKRVRQFGEHELPELVDRHCVRSMREGLERVGVHLSDALFQQQASDLAQPTQPSFKPPGCRVPVHA